MRSRSEPKHKRSPCGVAWCVDPHCGVTREIERPSLFREVAGELAGEFRAVRMARLASAPRRIATRFGVSLVLALTASFGISIAPAGTLDESDVDPVGHHVVVEADLID